MLPVEHLGKQGGTLNNAEHEHSYAHTPDNYLVIGSFDHMSGIAQADINETLGALDTMRLRVRTDLESWVILSEVGLLHCWVCFCSLLQWWEKCHVWRHPSLGLTFLPCTYLWYPMVDFPLSDITQVLEAVNWCAFRDSWSCTYSGPVCWCAFRDSWPLIYTGTVGWCAFRDSWSLTYAGTVGWCAFRDLWPLTYLGV